MSKHQGRAPDTSWYVVVDLARGPDGRRRQKWHGSYRTHKEAEVAKAKLTNEVHSGLYVEPSKVTLQDWVESSWLPTMRSQVKASTWDSHDIDLSASRIAIRHTLVSVAYEIQDSTPKTHQARVVELDSGTIEQLRAHQLRQATQRAAWGAGYHESDLTFRREDGSPVHPDSFTQAFEAEVRRSGLPRIRLHDLRHTHATIALRAGIPVKVISERLGHENPAFTMKQYAHVLPGMQAEAAALIASLITSPSPQP